MAHVANTIDSETSPRPYMDRLTHAILKEASKSLKYYMDVKSRENAFILDKNGSVWGLIPSKTKIFLGTNNKQQTSSCNSHTTDKDMKNSSSSFQYKPKQLEATLPSPEKQMCREELNFHMRSYSFLGNENSKTSDVQSRSTNRSNSLNVTKRHIRSRSAFKLSRDEKDHLIDNTADIFASMVKSRRSMYETNLISQQKLPLSRIVNPTSRQIDNQSDIQPSVTDLQTLPKQNESSKKTISFTQKSKPVRKGALCEYKVSITTGNCNGASTNAPIRIKLYGNNGHTNFHELTHSKTHHVPFLKNQTDIFILHTYHVGVLIGITIGHERKDMKASWYLSKVSIDDPVRKIIYEISCNGWLSIKSNDQKTMRDFPVISTVPYDEKNNSEEYQEDIESQSGLSIPSTNVTITSNNRHKHQKKQRRVSIGPASVAQKPSQIIKQEVVSECQSRSPIFSATSSDETEINDNITNQNYSKTSTPSPTLNETRLKSVSEHHVLDIKPTNDMFQRYSVDYDRPTTPLCVSPEQLKHSEERE